ncbi:MAG: hypothetical protein HY348_10925 [Nitrospira defluvii]|nr:hypothetical protein [Nitrospira defluvii]
MRLAPETRTRKITNEAQQTTERFEYDASVTTRRPLVILGSGYTGLWIWRLAKQQTLPIYASSRRPDLHLTDVEPEARLRFDLAEPATWPALPPDVDLIWTFPATPLEQVQAFVGQYCNPSQRLVVLGSTSAYGTDSGHADGIAPWIDEASPINASLPRVQGEEYLRMHHGAIILRVAGIYGPQRNPLEWIRQGRVGPTDKFVNLIHVEDLAEISLRMLLEGVPGEVYNVSDGQPRTWRDICHEIQRRWNVTASSPEGEGQMGKRISTDKLRKRLQYAFRHADLYRALEELAPP